MTPTRIYAVPYRFGPFTLDVAAFRLLRDDRPVSVSPQSLDVLSHLVSRPSMLVTKDELFTVVWRDVIVTDNALTRAVSDLRQALGDDPAKPRYIQTIARRGYRFIAPVTDASPRGPASPASHRPRETSSLDAYRLVAEGRVRLESLDSAAIQTAVENFTQAIELDPAYGPAYIGLANAHFWLYEQSRYQADPDANLLALAIKEARCAQRIDGMVGEAHATLAYLLTAADQLEDARTAARRAIALEPDYWAHHFRLAHAAWGEERLRALQRCRDLYAEFSFAYFQIAMVHVARSAVESAELALRRGTAVEDGQAARRQRFPANGLRWMLGLIHLRRGDVTEAVTHFERELDGGRGQLYATEFAIAARNAWGFALLHQQQIDQALAMFRQALEAYPVQPRARLGMALAFGRHNLPTEAERELRQAREQMVALERSGRTVDAAMFRAGEHAVRGRQTEAITTLRDLLAAAPAGAAGWLIPIDPLFEPLQTAAGYHDLLGVLAVRAR